MAKFTSKKRIYIKAFSFRKSALERNLIAVSVSVLFVLVLAQVGLQIPQARSGLTDIEVYEGIDLAGQLPEAEIVLSADSEAASDAVVLLNGAPYAQFLDGRCAITILNRGLIEIDGRKCASDFKVTVSEADRTIAGIREGDCFLIGRGMTIIGRVGVTKSSD